ncbi:hypothetical protein HIM_05338 [Hirsutella minnesotensis 3608]|uniref:Uncharacterized protein n=1 Tax=Hirsutella minnesotensis 3608 TaxID=1043627 RepID=A0A0F8A5D6_9HYPO|nr:hypothetical protein HIM_05338 [Hirsutella minnesotensis 3608]
MFGLSKSTAAAILTLLHLLQHAGASDSCQLSGNAGTAIQPIEPGNKTEILSPGVLSHNPFDTLWALDSGGSWAGNQIMRHSSTPPWRNSIPSAYWPEGSRQHMGVVFLCNNKWYYNSVYWKGSFFGGGSFRQDRDRNQINLKTSIGQRGSENAGAMLHENPIEILTEKKSSACSAGTTWKGSGSFFAPLAAALRNLVLLISGNGENMAIGAAAPNEGLSGAVSCDPISPLWLEKSNTVVKFANEERYTAAYKLRAQFNYGEGNGGLAPPRRMMVSCSNDKIWYTGELNDPSWVVFW